MSYYGAVRRILIIIFVFNIFTALAKGIYGLFIGSLSMQILSLPWPSAA